MLSIWAVCISVGISVLAAPKEEGLALHYDMSRQGGRLLDVSGNGNHGMMHNITGRDFSRYRQGDVLNLDGSQKYVEIPRSAGLGDEVTVEVTLTSQVNQMHWAWCLGSKSADTAYHYLFLDPNQIGDGRILAAIKDGSREQRLPLSAVMDGTKAYHTITVTHKTNETALYLDGERIGDPINSGYSLSAILRDGTDPEENFIGYIGKSLFHVDPYFSGSIADFKIYSRALPAAEVRQGSDLNEAARELDVAQAVYADLDLPREGLHGAAISWVSSQPDAISPAGKVCLGDSRKAVTLTATVALGGRSCTKAFDVEVLAKDEVAPYMLSSLNLPYALSARDTLPALQGAQVSISWKSAPEGYVTTDGRLITGFDGMEQVTLTAEAKDKATGAVLASKEFPSLLMGQDSAYVLGYYRKGGTPQADSLHLAYSQDGKSFEALYFNTGILFPHADFEADRESGKMVHLKEPYLFRLKDGRIGVAARRESESKRPGAVLLYATEDMLKYQPLSDDEAGLLQLGQEEVYQPRCEYDSSSQAYRIYWEDGKGGAYYSTTADFKSVSAPVACQKESRKAEETGIASAIPGNVLAVTQAEADKLLKKLRPVENTSMSAVSIRTSVGKPLGIGALGDKVTAHYTDTSTRAFPVQWDEANFKAVDFSKEGTYQVRGTVLQKSYQGLDLPRKADPTAVAYQGKYYFVSTEEAGNNSEVYIRKASTVEGLWNPGAEQARILKNRDFAGLEGLQWAPELHVVGGRLCFFVSSSHSGNWDGVRSIVFTLKDGGDPLRQEDWGNPHEFLKKDGSVLYAREKGISLDMTYFENQGRHYVCWAQRGVFGTEPKTSDIYIGEIAPAEPWKLISNPVMLKRCDQSWDRDGGNGDGLGGVDEGPFAILHGGKVFLTYSGGSHTLSNGKQTGTYTVGLLTASQGADLLNAASWEVTDYPILPMGAVNGETASGHHSFVTDTEGNDVFVYHTRDVAASDSPWDRRVRARIVHWAYDGTPILYMTPEMEIKPGNKNITATITVTEDAQPHVHTFKPFTQKAKVGKNGYSCNKCATCGKIQGKKVIYAVKALTVKKGPYVYNKKEKKPSVTLKDAKGNVIPKKYYSISYQDNKKVGRAVAIAKLKGNYTGKVKASFDILPQGTSLTKLKALPKGFQAAWKKQPSQVTGYEVQYAANSKFTKKASAAKKIAKAGTVSKSFSKLKAKKTYYVRVRTYKIVKVNGKRKVFYSAWSKARKVRCR